MKNFLSVILCVCSFSLFAQIPMGSILKQQIDETFFASESLDLLKIQAYENLIEERIEELTNIIVNFEMNRNGRSYEKALRKAMKNDTIKNLKLIFPLLNELRNSSDMRDQYQLADKILDLDYGLRSEITPINWNGRLVHSLSQFLASYEIPKNANPMYGEASNLIDPSSGKILTQEQLEQMKLEGRDISLLDPPAKNGVIELIDIEKVNVKEKFLGGDNDMHRGLDISWPAQNVGKLKKIKKTQSRPKVIFEALDQNGIEKEWKLKMMMEIHSEPTAASLASALGFYTDISKYVGAFKIYLDKMSYDEFVVDFSSYYEPEFLHTIMKEHGEDERGEYIIFKEGMLEARFEDEELNRIGPYYPTRKKGLRETRAWQIFNLWINNTDLKPGENNKLTAREIDGELRLFGFQHDIGFAFGDWLRERPTNFRWNVVKKITGSKIVFQFNSAVIHEGWDHVSFADGRWFTRKIAQLSRKQIRDAVELGNWPNEAPYNYEQLLIEKLIARRNDLVKAFDLVGEKLPNGKTISLMEFDRSVEKEAKPTHVLLEGETVDFREEKTHLFVTQPMEMLNDLVKTSGQSIISGISKINLSPVWYGIDEFGFVAEVLTNFSRNVTANPNPTSEKDLFIVRDDWALGMRLGKGFGLGIETIGDVGYVREYSLIYTVASPEEANRRSRFVVDFKMPYRVLKRGLPKNHILITQNYLEGRGRIRAEVPNILIGPGAETSLSRIVLNRTVIGHKEDGSVTLYDDNSQSQLRNNRLYLDLGLFKLDQYRNSREEGHIQRFVTKLDSNTENEDVLSAIDDAVANHNFSALREFAHDQRVESDFIERESRLNFFGLVSWNTQSRVDDIEIFNFDEQGNLVSMDYQLDAVLYKENSWKWLLNGETKYQKIRLNSSYNEASKELVEPSLEINIGSNDLTTWEEEMTEEYIPFFNGVAGNSNFFKFTPHIHAYNHVWGQIEFILTQTYHKEALDKILTMTKEDIKYAIADAVGISHAKMDRQWAWNTASQYRRDRMTPPEHLRLEFFGHKYDMDRIIKRADRFQRALMKAQRYTHRAAQVDKIVNAFKKIIPKKGGFYSPVMLYILNKFVGPKNYLITAQMVIPEVRDLENKLPGRMRPYFQQGTVRERTEKDRIIMSTKDAVDLYHSVMMAN